MEKAWGWEWVEENASVGQTAQDAFSVSCAGLQHLRPIRQPQLLPLKLTAPGWGSSRGQEKDWHPGKCSGLGGWVPRMESQTLS